MLTQNLLVLLLVVVVIGCSSKATPYELALGQDIGKSRQAQIAQMIQLGSWYHETCTMKQSYATDIFFFGSKDYDKANIVIVDSYLTNGEMLVEKISTFEPYAWNTAYGDCIDRSRFE